MKRLIINADDFGLTPGVNRAIIELHRRNRLTSATLMAEAGFTQDASTAALATPSLGVGCHVVLVDGTPILNPAELPTLVDQATGRFRRTLGRFVLDLTLGRINPAEIAAEASAQIFSLHKRGVQVTHIDTHKHTHMFPRVLKPLLEAAKLQKIRAIRNPFEPGWSLAATPGAPALRRAQVLILNRMQPAFRRLVHAAGLTSTDGAIGVLATGTLNAPTISSLLQAMPDGVWELVTHPGYNDQALSEAGTRLVAARQVEIDALSQAIIPPDVSLIHFGQIHSGEPVGSSSNILLDAH